MLSRLATYSYGAALVTLPWTGVGLLKLTTGRDWGGGLQPSWFLLAVAILFGFLDRLPGRAPRGGTGPVSPAGSLRWWCWGLAAVFASVLVSAAGLWLAPSGQPLGQVLGKFGKQTVQLVVMVVFALVPLLWTRGRGRWAWTVKMLLIGGFIQVVYGILQGWAYYHHDAVFNWLDGVFTSNPSILSGSGELYLGDSFRHVPRLRGMVCEPLYLGNYLLFLWPWTLVPLFSVRIRRVAAVAFLLLLAATWSRGAWLGLAAQLVVAGALALRLGKNRGTDLIRFRGGKARWLVLGGAALLLVGPVLGWALGFEGLLFPYRRLAQTFSGRDWSNLTRLYSMQAAWRAFLLSPVLGVGWGQFGWHFPALVDPMGLQSQFTWPVVNNFPLLILCETGLFGFLVFTAWIGGMARGILARAAALHEPGSGTGAAGLRGAILMAATVSAAGVLVQLMTFSQYNLPHIWVAFGLLGAMLTDREPDFGSGAGTPGP